jgi:hypothetical protein
MTTLQEKVCINVSYQDSLMTAGRNEKVCVNVSYQDSLMTAGRNDCALACMYPPALYSLYSNAMYCVPHCVIYAGVGQ